MDDDTVIPPDAPRPRLCHLKKWSDFNGYGFNLHAERGKAGQFIGTIDLGSPSEVTALKAGDRIVEVNGINIGSENHQQVVQRIKAVSNETRLLVVDAETDAYYRERKILIHGNMPNIEHHETPDVNPFTQRSSAVADSMNNMKLSDADFDKYQARLCRLRTWPDFAGYGFNLHADRSKKGQFIGKVDPGSPAEASGLQENDRIIEVNGTNVVDKSHADVVVLIKSRQGEVDLLVVDSEADGYFQTHGVNIHGSMSGLITITCPSTNPHSANGGVAQSAAAETTHESDQEDMQYDTHSGDYGKSVVYEESHTSARVEIDSGDSVTHISDSFHTNRETVGSGHDDLTVSKSESHGYEVKQEQSISPVTHQSHSPAPASSASVSSTASVSSSTVAPFAGAGKPVTVGGIEFAGSAKEARERMNKKRNVKTDPNLSLKDKYDILQRL